MAQRQRNETGLMTCHLSYPLIFCKHMLYLVNNSPIGPARSPQIHLKDPSLSTPQPYRTVQYDTEDNNIQSLGRMGQADEIKFDLII